MTTARSIPGLATVRILALSIAGAILYGVLHDQVTARVCVDYFTVTHPRIIDSESPTLLALAWGIVATWWVGAILGVLLAIAARAGGEPRVSARALLRPIAVLLVVMGAIALGAGITGYTLSSRGVIHTPQGLETAIAPERHARWMGVWWAHNASYDAGFVGGLVLVALTLRRRWRERGRAAPASA